MLFEDYFPIWNKLTDIERELLMNSAVKRTAPKGTYSTTALQTVWGCF
jgi:hypothetical protein